MRTPSATAKSQTALKVVIDAPTKLWRQYCLTNDQVRYVDKEVHRTLTLEQLPDAPHPQAE